jgi:Mce-associated membrane protein
VTAAGQRDVDGWSARKRWIVLAVSLVVAVACLASAVGLFAARSAGEGLGDRVSSLAKDEVPQSAETEERETLLSAARTFVLRFNNYSPEMLDDTDHLPDYAATSDLMTPTFATVFDDNVGYAEQTVVQLGATRTAEVYAVGVASQDPDSARVLVAGTVELSYPYPDEADQQTSDDEQQGDSSDDPQIVSTGPQRFRYEVSLVKVDGEWLVDNLDDIDDGLPAFADPMQEGQQQPGLPTPSGPTQPTPDGTSSEGGRR